MTKSLTEQWRDGTLEQRYYYVKYFAAVGKPFVEIELKSFLLDLVKVKDRDKIEVLAPVPSYDEWKQAKENLDKNGTWYTERSYKLLEKKLEIATKALKEYADKDKWEHCSPIWRDAEEALKEMEGVK